MLAVSTLRIERGGDMEDYAMEGKDFPDFNDGDLFDCIDFDDLFAEINDEDLLPDLEIDPELLAEFSASNAPLGFMENIVSSSASTDKSKSEDEINSSSQKDEDEINGGASVSDSRPWTRINNQGHDVISKTVLHSSTKQDDKGTKSSSSSRSKNPLGKKKMKVDWTPELHRRFVQAVEQLGVDKAVPSRILELMGIDCLTRHNIASHLQKYRSHRKHMLAREAEAASWNQKRHVVAVKRDPGWTNIAPTMGFPPVAPVPMPPHYNRPPLHVWGHPSVPEQSMVHTWSTNLSPPPHAWPPSQRLPPSSNPSFWHPHRHVPTQGTTCYPPHLPPMRFASPPPVMYKVAAVIPPGEKMPEPPCHDHPSKESVDAAVEDVLSKPWLPLPLGLKPPSMDSVMVELQSKGMPKIPPTTTCA